MTEPPLLSDNGETIANALCQGTAIAIMDGSFKAKLGTVSFLVKGVTSINQLVAVNQAPGYPDDQSTLLSELEGGVMGWC